VLYFIEVASADLAVARVAHRVARGGHDVPEVDIRRRFARGLLHFETFYKSTVDEWYHWRSDEQAFGLSDYGPQ
jgi:predicted ABC-type ATPase